MNCAYNTQDWSIAAFYDFKRCSFQKEHDAKLSWLLCYAYFNMQQWIYHENIVHCAKYTLFHTVAKWMPLSNSQERRGDESLFGHYYFPATVIPLDIKFSYSQVWPKTFQYLRQKINKWSPPCPISHSYYNTRQRIWGAGCFIAAMPISGKRQK